MRALDPFTAASGHYADAVRSMRPHKSGEALELMPARMSWKPIAWALIPSLIGWAAIIGIGWAVVGAVSGLLK